MKLSSLNIRFLLTISMALGFAAISLKAQNIAQDAIFTDIVGKEYALYDYLEQGKTVIIDFSTTWCGPCWAYHNTHELDSLYLQYGPDGTDELMVFFIESDPSTGMMELSGLGPGTEGNWIDGTSYPIVDDHTIAEQFGVSFFPYIVTICPDRTFSLSGTWDHDMHYEYALNNCPDPILEKDLSILNLDSDTLVHCISEFTPQLKMLNLNADGSEITDLTIRTLLDGNVQSETDWSGNLSMLHVLDLTLPSMSDLSGKYLLTFEVEYEGDLDVTNNTSSHEIIVNSPIESGNMIQLDILADDQAQQIQWYFQDQVSGDFLASGSAQLPDQVNSTTIDLSQDMSCYVFVISDSGGDGNAGASYYELTDLATGSVLVSESEEFGHSTSASIEVTSIVSSIESLDLKELDIIIHPNPVDDLLMVTMNDIPENGFLLELRGLFGETIYRDVLEKGTTQLKIDTSRYPSGVYHLILTSGRTYESRKVMIQH